jgi:hypothetical protein
MEIMVVPFVLICDSTLFKEQSLNSALELQF